jgi:hypothetical protein
MDEMLKRYATQTEMTLEMAQRWLALSAAVVRHGYEATRTGVSRQWGVMLVERG